MGDTIIVQDISKCASFLSSKTGKVVKSCTLNLKNPSNNATSTATVKFSSTDARFFQDLGFKKKRCDPKKEACEINFNDFF